MDSIDRRTVLKLGSAASLAVLAPSAPASTAPAAQSAHASVPQWEAFEVTLAGPSSGNPFTDVDLTVTFAQGNRSVSLDGFYDGNGSYKIRFMPDSPGEWSYTTASNAPELSGRTGRFSCTAALAGAHWPVRVANTHHFAYADGTPFPTRRCASAGREYRQASPLPLSKTIKSSKHVS